MNELNYVFPTGTGNIESRSNITKRGFLPTQVTAGVAVASEKKDERWKYRDGREVRRHARASPFLCFLVNQPTTGRRAWASGKSRFKNVSGIARS